MLGSSRRLNACPWVATGTITPLSQLSQETVAWSIALSPGVATAIPIDGVAELSPRDSAALVAVLARLVSALPDDSGSAQFRGLPIVVRDAWTFTVPEDSARIVVAIALRSLNVESNPRSEAVLLMAEWSRAAPPQLRTAFARRTSGPEDQIEGTDVLAALHLSSGGTTVAVLREDDTGAHVDLIARGRDGWHEAWSSSQAGCRR